MSQKQANLIQSVQALLAKVDAEEKRAEANTEAGGYMGGTSHPVKDVDDRTEPASTGARSEENSRDVKQDQGPAGVESQSEGFPGGQDSVQLNIGLENKATGEDPRNEDDYKDTKDDPGSSHPARTDNNALDGNKYSAFQELRQLAKQANEAGTVLLAAITVDVNGKQQPKQAATTEDESETKPETKPAAKQAAAKPAANADADLAGVFADLNVPLEDKQASDQLVIDTLESVLALADARAVKTAQFYMGLFKQAEEECASEDETDDKPEETEGESDSANFPEAGGSEDAAAGAGGDELASLLSGGKQMGAEPAMAAMAGGGGGMPPGAEGGMPPGVEGGMPPGAEGGMPPGAEGGMPPGAEGAGGLEALLGGGGAEAGGALPEGDPTMGNEEALQMVLQQLGIDPAQLQTLMAGKMAQDISHRVSQKLASQAKVSDKKGPKTAGDARLLAAMTEVIREISRRN